MDKENKRENYKIHAELPQIVGDSGKPLPSHVSQFNATIRSSVYGQIADFKKSWGEDNASSISPETGKPIEIPSGELYITSEMVMEDKNFISLVLRPYTYLGGAHGFEGTIPINFDRRAGVKLTLGDLFKPGTSYLPLLSRHCIDTLKHSLASWYVNEPSMTTLHSGADPKQENYQNWEITPYGLVIVFTPYQVAAYAAGTSEVVIPWSLLKNKLRTQYSAVLCP